MAKSVLRSITELIGFYNRGTFAAKVDEHIEHAIRTLEALPSEKGTATVTITLTIAYENGMTQTTPAVKSKLPEEKAFAANILWVHDGAFSVQHPSQMDIFAGPEDVADRQRRREAGA